MTDIAMLSHRIDDENHRPRSPREPEYQPISQPQPQEWLLVLRESLVRNCLAPSEEAILRAYELYCEALYAPFWAREKQMANRYADIARDVAALQALFPKRFERAAARNPWEFAHLIDHNSEEKS